MHRVFVTVALVVLVSGVVAASSAAAPGTTQVRGIQSPDDGSHGCIAGVGAYWMAGSGQPGIAGLVGCWYTVTFELGVVTPSGVVTGTGTEAFSGCLDRAGDGTCVGDPGGSLTFSFRATAKYDPETFTILQHGRCHHPITGGSGAFAGASGELRFKDDPATGCSYYSGHVALAG